MSKGQRGNKEAKKPKQVRAAAAPPLPVTAAPTVPVVAPDRFKRK